MSFRNYLRWSTGYITKAKTADNQPRPFLRKPVEWHHKAGLLACFIITDLPIMITVVINDNKITKLTATEIAPDSS